MAMASASLGSSALSAFIFLLSLTLRGFERTRRTGLCEPPLLCDLCVDLFLPVLNFCSRTTVPGVTAFASARTYYHDGHMSVRIRTARFPLFDKSIAR
jgi:hypothetical protein